MTSKAFVRPTRPKASLPPCLKTSFTRKILRLTVSSSLEELNRYIISSSNNCNPYPSRTPDTYIIS